MLNVLLPKIMRGIILFCCTTLVDTDRFRTDGVTMLLAVAAWILAKTSAITPLAVAEPSFLIIRATLVAEPGFADNTLTDLSIPMMIGFYSQLMLVILGGRLHPI